MDVSQKSQSFKQQILPHFKSYSPMQNQPSAFRKPSVKPTDNTSEQLDTANVSAFQHKDSDEKELTKNESKNSD